MKKSNLLATVALAATFAICGGALAGCDNTQHTHKYSSGWEKDSTGHWHVATCDDLKQGDKDYTKDFAAHVWGGDDECDVCKYKKATETPIVTEYTITLDANGGTLEGDKETADVETKNGKIETLPTPTAPDGMEFVGWYTEQNGGTAVTTDTAFTAKGTIYAHYVNVYTITLDLNYDGQPEEKAIVAANTSNKLDALPADPVREGYAFLGWYNTSATSGGSQLAITTTLSADVTYYARWREIIMVTFDFNYEGSTPIVMAATFKEGSTTYSVLSELPAAPTREGYEFVDWFTQAEGGSKVDVTKNYNKHTTVYAHWIVPGATFTVTFDLNYEGSAAASTKTTTGAYLTELPENPIREGYDFWGWYKTVNDNGSASGEITTDTEISGDIPVYALWRVPYTVTFNLNYDEAPEPEVLVAHKEEGTTSVKLSALPEDPVREGYTFNGWYTKATGGTKITATKAYTKDTVVYAQWTKNS